MSKKKVTAISGTITLDLSKASTVPEDSDRLQLAAQVLTIKDDGGFAAAAEIVSTCAKRIRAHEEDWEGSKKLAHEAHASICATLKRLTGPYVKVREVLESKMRVYRNEQERLNAAAQAKIQESGTELKNELLQEAKGLRRMGDIKEAKRLEAQAETVILDVALPDVKPEVPNLQERRPMKGYCDKPMELIVAVAEGRVALLQNIIVRGGGVEEVPIIEINDRALQYLAKSLGEDISLRFPGCRAKAELSFAFTADKSNG